MKDTETTAHLYSNGDPAGGATSRRRAPLLLMVLGLAVLCASLLIIPWVVRAQVQEVTPSRDATGDVPPAKPTNLQASAEHDAVTLTWTASTDQSVTHYAILRRNRDTDAVGVFHVIDSNAGAETSYTDGSVAAASRYGYRVKSVSPTGVSLWSGFVKADTPTAPDPTPMPTTTPEPEPQTAPVDLAPSGLSAALVEGGGVTLSWSAPAEDADSVTGYEVLRAVGEGDLATLVADTGSTATSYTDATATEAGETYAYQVKAIRGEDRSQASGQAQVPDVVVSVVVEVTVPGVPENLSAVWGSAAVALSWTEPTSDGGAPVTGYQYRYKVGAAEFGNTWESTGTGQSVAIDGLTNGVQHTFEVQAVNSQGGSGGASIVVMPLADRQGSVRIGGDLNNLIRPEVFYDNRWGVVCDDYFDNKDAVGRVSTDGFGGGNSRPIPSTGNSRSSDGAGQHGLQGRGRTVN